MSAPWIQGDLDSLPSSVRVLHLASHNELSVCPGALESVDLPSLTHLFVSEFHVRFFFFFAVYDDQSLKKNWLNDPSCVTLLIIFYDVVRNHVISDMISDTPTMEANSFFNALSKNRTISLSNVHVWSAFGKRCRAAWHQ